MKKRGSIALAALVTLVVVLIIAIGLISLAGGTLFIGKRQSDMTALRSLAEAGVQYGYWEYAWQGVSVPYTLKNKALGNGSFTVTVTDNRSAVGYTLNIVSTATIGAQQTTVTRVFADPGAGGPKKYGDFALFSNTAFSESLKTIVTGSKLATGDLFVNGDTSLTAKSSKVWGNVYCTGLDKITALTGKDYAYLKPLTLPQIDFTYYRAVASRTFSTAQTWNNFRFLSPYEIVYVNGDVVLSGSISGTGTIVCTGAVTIPKAITYQDAASKLAVLTSGPLTVAVNGNFAGFYYAHNAAGNAVCAVTGKAQNTQGFITADSFSVTGSLTILRDSAFNTSLGQSLRMPGY